MATSSTESAIISRETSEVFIPSVPMVMPSEMATVFISIGIAAGGLDAFLDGMRQRAQAEVAGHGLDPGIGDQDHRLLEVLIGQPDALEHRPGAGALDAVEDMAALVPHIERTVLMPVGPVRGGHRRSFLVIAWLSCHKARNLFESGVSFA